MDRVDVVIFGATGYTGKYAVTEMVRLAAKHGLSWAVAGRSLHKLQALMDDTARRTGENLSNIKIIIADVNDEESLKAMCRQAKVIVNCCGPYRLYGEAVVKAAIDCKAHHVDVSGEPQYMETIQLYYNEAASDAGVYVVAACGLDSIPADMGMVYLQDQFPGTLSTVESYLNIKLPKEMHAEAKRYGSIHVGTWDSLIHSLAHFNELKPLRKKMFPEGLPPTKVKLTRRGVFHKRGGNWYVPFLGSDESVVLRSQCALWGERRAQMKAYVCVGGWLQAFALVLGLGLLLLMAQFKFTRNLLLTYPRLFSFGLINPEGPTEAVTKASTFTMDLCGEGWLEGTDRSSPPNKKLTARVSGADPGYGMTVKSLLLSAVTILKESHNMPGKGGVLTTAVAFKNTTLIKSLVEEGVNFEILGN